MEKVIKVLFIILIVLFLCLSWFTLFKLFPKTTAVITFIIGMLAIILLALITKER